MAAPCDGDPRPPPQWARPADRGDGAMSRTLNVKVDASRVSIAKAIRAVAHAGAPLALTARALNDLAAELGSMDAAASFLADLAEEVGKPVAVQFGTGEDTSSTVFVPPAGWS